LDDSAGIRETCLRRILAPHMIQPIDWRDEALSQLRTLIYAADPDIVEEVKFRKPSNSMMGVPVWYREGIICTGETYKDKIKLTFAKGAFLNDPSGLFNSSLSGSTRRAIDLFEGDSVDESAFVSLVKEALAFNESQGGS
jgi:hypothetical protein